MSVSVDADLIDGAEAAARRGQVATVSAWVNDALRMKLQHERRLQALAAFIDSYEAEHGAISPDEMERAARRANARAVTVRALAEGPRARRRGGAR